MYSSYFIGVSLKFIQIAFLLISVAPMFNGILHHRKNVKLKTNKKWNMKKKIKLDFYVKAQLNFGGWKIVEKSCNRYELM